RQLLLGERLRPRRRHQDGGGGGRRRAGRRSRAARIGGKVLVGFQGEGGRAADREVGLAPLLGHPRRTHGQVDVVGRRRAHGHRRRGHRRPVRLGGGGGLLPLLLLGAPLQVLGDHATAVALLLPPLAPALAG